MFKFSLNQFSYPEKKLNIDEMLAKFIKEGMKEHEEIGIFIRGFRTTNHILLKEQNNLLSELQIEVQQLSKVMNDVLINEANDNHNEPSGFQRDKQEKPQEVIVENESSKVQERTIQPSMESQQPSIPFPNRLIKEKEEAQQRKFLENLRQLHINIPFIEALVQMSKYAKYLKNLLTNKSRLEEAYLGASISFMPYTMYEKLGLGEPKPTSMSFELVDRSIQYPRGIVENVLIKVDKFVLLVDFVILDMPEDSRIPIILGRPFLATARAMIDVFNKKITLKVGDDEVIFDMEQSIKKPSTEDDDLDGTINEETHDFFHNANAPEDQEIERLSLALKNIWLIKGCRLVLYATALSNLSMMHDSNLPCHGRENLWKCSWMIFSVLILTGLSRKRRRSPMTSLPALPPISGALSPVRADLIPSPKRVRDSGYLADVEAEIDECFAYTGALRDRGIDARVVVEAVDREESETGARGLVEVRVERVTHPAMPEDIPEPAQEGAVEVIEGVQREQGHRIVGVESVVTTLTERITELERDNHGQQPPFKRQNVSGQNVARSYTAGNNERKGYAGPRPLCNKCRYHHVGPCTVKCNNCKRVGHQTRDCRSAVVVPNMQRAPLGNQQGVICYECGRPGHVKRECPKLINQNHGNRVGNKTGNQTGGNEATARAYAISGGGTNPDSNVVTGTFLLNNCYDSMLFDSGADRSFVSSIFSALLDVAPSTLETIYAVELADGRISETNVVLRGCTLGLLGHPFDIDLMPV
ncbi:putative reverse transcriptase domain-containing protein, partial [Tanacetum coccineum]